MTSLAHQLYAFSMTVLAGVTLGVLFEGQRVVRAWLRPRAALGWLLDLVFWVVATPAVFAFLVAGNWGELRFYVFLGLAAGVALHFALFSPLVLELLFFLSNLAGRLAILLVAIGGGIVLGPARLIAGCSQAWGRPRLQPRLGLRAPLRWRPGLLPFLGRRPR